MKHFNALILKYAMVAIILEITLNWLTGLSFQKILFLSLVVTLVSYVIGDMLLLSRSGSSISTLVDTGISLAVIYLFNFIQRFGAITFTAALISAVAIGIGELFFHRYLVRRVFPDRTGKRHGNLT